MSKIRIEIDCDEWYVADSLHILGGMVENNDLLDEMTDGKVEVSDDHFSGTISVIEQ